MYARRLLDARARFLDRLERIEQEAHDHLLHLDPVTIHSGQIGFEVQLDIDASIDLELTRRPHYRCHSGLSQDLPP